MTQPKEFIARVPEFGGTFANINVSERFKVANIDEAISALNDNGYFEGMIYDKADSADVLNALDTGYDSDKATKFSL